MYDTEGAIITTLMFDCEEGNRENFLFELLTLFLLPVRQYADICLFSTAQYKCPVAQLEAE